MRQEMNLQPWTDGDLAAQERAGYDEGHRHCRQGWCQDCMADGHVDTPFARGYRRGWAAARDAGLHGKEMPCRR